MGSSDPESSSGAGRARPAIDPDFSPEIVADLYRHQPKQVAKALPIALLLGPLGGHRFYLGFFWTGVLMVLTAGGGLLWWTVDLLRLRSLVDACNREERERERRGLPPRALAFLPPRACLRLDTPPAWVSFHRGRQRAIARVVLLLVLGYGLGKTSRALGLHEPIVVMGLFIVVSALATRAPGLRHVPLIGALMRWVHRLRLFYHCVDPGGVGAVGVRLTFGILLAPWRPKVRAEVRLHLQMGGAVVGIFTLVDLLGLINAGSVVSGMAMLALQFLQTILCTYLFVAPVSALLTTQTLLDHREGRALLLSAATSGAMLVGLS